MSPAAYVVQVFGGYTETAKAAGVDRAAPYKWVHRTWKSTPGGVPHRHYRALLDSAKLRGLDLTADDLINGRELAVSL